jgi:glycerol-3-phosphate acyltransferase PlsX
MTIVLDGYGGDNAPLEVLRGAAEAVREYGVSVTVTGDENALRTCAQENNVALDGIAFAHAPLVMPVDEEPGEILKSYSDCSMAHGLRLLAQNKADAFVSAGSTGALLMGATFIVKRIRGVKRPALGAMIPTGQDTAYLLLDSGANNDCRPDMLAQFAVMGAAYCEKVFGIANPRVGLINIGTEESKGGVLQQEAYEILKNVKAINFIGNVEARELPAGACDVAVCDGFTGNIVLKLTEGYAKFFSGLFKDILLENFKTKVAALFLKKGIARMRMMMDYKEHGGAPLLGVRYPVIKAHGSSDARAFKNAVRQAMFCCENDVAGQIERGVAELREVV